MQTPQVGRFVLVALLALSSALHAQEAQNSERHEFRIEAFVQDLGIPWGMAFLPDGRLLISEQIGRAHV